MNAQRIYLLPFCALALLPALAFGEDVRLCVRGHSLVKGQEFLQTRQLLLALNGPTLEEELKIRLAAGVLKAKIWPELSPDEIAVVPFDDRLCGAEPQATATLSYKEGEVGAIRAERGRGPADSPSTNAVTQQGTGKAASQKMRPAGVSPSAKRFEALRVFIATNRNLTGSKAAGQAFGAERDGHQIHLGAVDVTIPADHKMANLESPSIVRMEWSMDPSRHVVLAGDYQPMDLTQWKAELSRRAGAFDGPGVLLFIHGYNNSFEAAARRAGQVAYDLAFAGPIVLFSWPSPDSASDYAVDERVARESYRKLAEILDHLTSLTVGKQKVTVLAHSMGNRIFTDGLVEFMRKRPAMDGAFGPVVLAAPDVGREEFRQQWVEDLTSAALKRQFTLYASDKDQPMKISGGVRKEPRLGAGGQTIAVYAPMVSVDASRITGEWFSFNHSYFGDNKTVMSDLFLVINQGLLPAKRPGLRLVTNGVNGAYWEFKR